MASVTTIAFIHAILFVIQYATADTTDFLSPFTAPGFDNICEEVNCGKGKCVPSQNMSNFFFECQCDPGWKQSFIDQFDHLKFLPCIIPNCTLDSACMESQAPVQNKPPVPMNNESILDPCSWTNCGGGTCKKESNSTYSCECSRGYRNLFNISNFPCLKNCALGTDCKNLGFDLSNQSTSSAPGLNEVDNTRNQAVSKLLGNHNWLLVLIMSTLAIF